MNKTGVFASPWPSKIRALEVGKSLIITDEELSFDKARILIMNTHQKYASKGFHFKIEHGAEGGFSLITRITKKEAVTLTKYGTPYKIAPPGTRAAKQPAKQPAKKPAPVAVPPPPVLQGDKTESITLKDYMDLHAMYTELANRSAPQFTVAGLAPKPIMVILVKQRADGVPFIDWSDVQQFSTEEETKAFLDQCANDPEVSQARIYTYSHRVAKQVTWAEL